MAALMEAIKKARPASSKGTYIKRITLTTTMGPGIKVDPVQAQGNDTPGLSTENVMESSMIN
jgi:hypothetical protein